MPMHEAAIVESIFNVLNAQIKEHRIKKVLKVKLRVGEMTAVENTTLIACFEVYAENTAVQGADLVIERVPLKARCQECKEEFPVLNYSFRCSRCGGTNVQVISGRELYIESIEAEKFEEEVNPSGQN
ncbi:hydrogenase maturation nickel metallochaperone HypA [Thermincola potens]|uniref:Hydrogenase maturation factor HypA n=1 Tax=Thermincola potens (strain JR) TaxID=635013 RepID=D5XDP4_THEPJ|nr:hydrogenase maturation nickel metallochaperone HypA [Thermincola potens]ADG83790.1 hydrogenase nickel insertion protein HypA [Thermincola potens JR]